MSTFHVMTGATGTIVRPTVRQIAVSDVFAALREGYEDFREKPSHYAFVALIYPIAGAIMIGWSSGVELLPMVYPLLAGFALVGPLLALGLMEISRRRELGQPANWSDVLSLFKSPSLPALLMMSLYLLTLFMVWLVVSRGLYLSLIGDYPSPGLFAFAGGILDHPNALAFPVLEQWLRLCSCAARARDQHRRVSYVARPRLRRRLGSLDLGQGKPCQSCAGRRLGPDGGRTAGDRDGDADGRARDHRAGAWPCDLALLSPAGGLILDPYAPPTA